MMRSLLSVCSLFLLSLGFAAEPVQVEGVENSYKISDELYRSAQPDREGFTALQKLGIRSVLNLREYHKDTPRPAIRSCISWLILWPQVK